MSQSIDRRNDGLAASFFYQKGRLGFFLCGQSIDRQNHGLAESSLAKRKFVSVNKMT